MEPVTSLARQEQPQRATLGTPRFDHGTFLMHRNRGRKMLAEKRLPEALAELQSARELRPRDEATLDLLGTIYHALDMRREAAAVYRQLLETHPEADVLHANLGVLEFKNGRFDDARRRLETALLLNPGNPRPHLYLGLIEKAQGNASACLRHLRTAGATDLIQRLGLERRDPSTDADTGPINIVVAAPGRLQPLSLESCLTRSAEPQAETFVVQTDPSTAADILVVAFSGEISVRAGRARLLHAIAGALHVGPPDAAGMMTLKGDGRVELLPFVGRPGRVLRVPMTRGSELHVAPGRLLALEPGVRPAGSAGERDLSRMLGQILTGATRLSGEGIAAISAGLNARAIQLTDREMLLAHPRDLVCWTGTLRARPAPMGRLDQLLAMTDDACGSVTLEGNGEIVIDSGA